MERLCRKPVRIPDSHLERMMKYPWPGNVRELRNVIERASLLLQGSEIRPADLLLQNNLDQALSKREQRGASSQDTISLEEVKKRHISSALKAYSGNKILTAKNLGISLSTLKRNAYELAQNTSPSLF